VARTELKLNNDFCFKLLRLHHFTADLDDNLIERSGLSLRELYIHSDVLSLHSSDVTGLAATFRFVRFVPPSYKEVMSYAAFVCLSFCLSVFLSVCLSVSDFTQKLLIKLS